jgi:hypothetical protein
MRYWGLEFRVRKWELGVWSLGLKVKGSGLGFND